MGVKKHEHGAGKRRWWHVTGPPAWAHCKKHNWVWSATCGSHFTIFTTTPASPRFGAAEPKFHPSPAPQSCRESYTRSVLSSPPAANRPPLQAMPRIVAEASLIVFTRANSWNFGHHERGKVAWRIPCKSLEESTNLCKCHESRHGKVHGRMWWEQQNANAIQCGNDLLLP